MTINSIVDLNQIQAAGQPQVNSNSKTFGCLCCTSGPLSATIRIPRYGYTPGEVIPVSAEIENLSGKAMNHTTAQLIKEVVFRATNGTKKTHKILKVNNVEDLKYVLILFKGHIETPGVFTSLHSCRK